METGGTVARLDGRGRGAHTTEEKPNLVAQSVHDPPPGPGPRGLSQSAEPLRVRPRGAGRVDRPRRSGSPHPPPPGRIPQRRRHQPEPGRRVRHEREPVSGVRARVQLLLRPSHPGLGAEGAGHERGDGSLPAGGAASGGHTGLPRGPGRVPEPRLHHHQEPPGHPGCGPPRGAGGPRRGPGSPSRSRRSATSSSG